MYGYIYRITDLTNRKCYIGQHKYDKPMLDPKYHGSSYILKNQIKKHPENFLEEIIFIAATSDELNYFENYFIEHLNTLYPNGYNLNTGGNKSILCETSREKTSKTLKGRFIGENNPRYGKHHTEEAKEKNRQAHLGKHTNGEWKKGHIPWNKGKKLPKDTILKRLQTLKDREISFEGENNPNFKYKITKEELYHLYIEENLTMMQIAKIYGCSITPIHRKLKKYNIKK